MVAPAVAVEVLRQMLTAELKVRDRYNAIVGMDDAGVLREYAAQLHTHPRAFPDVGACRRSAEGVLLESSERVAALQSAIAALEEES